MLLINGVDLTTRLVSPPDRGWKFSPSPGAVTYSALSSLSLTLRLRESDLVQDGMLVQYTEVDGYERVGTVSGTRREGSSSVSVDVRDRVQAKIDAQVVSGVWVGTPASVLSQIMGSYGIPASSSLVDARQRREGYAVQVTLSVTDAKSLSSVTGDLCSAGWMRSAIVDGVLFVTSAAQSVPSNAPSLHPSDLRGIPEQDPPVSRQYEGGRVQWVGGEAVDLSGISGALPTFAADYSAPPYEFLGPDGAMSLIESATRSTPRTWKVAVRWDLARIFTPAEWVYVEGGIIAPGGVSCRIMGVERSSMATASIYIEESA